MTHNDSSCMDPMHFYLSSQISLQVFLNILGKQYTHHTIHANAFAKDFPSLQLPLFNSRLFDSQETTTLPPTFLVPPPNHITVVTTTTTTFIIVSCPKKNGSHGVKACVPNVRSKWGWTYHEERIKWFVGEFGYLYPG
jgi:hypothetical protein